MGSSLGPLDSSWVLLGYSWGPLGSSCANPHGIRTFLGAPRGRQETPRAPQEARRGAQKDPQKLVYRRDSLLASSLEPLGSSWGPLGGPLGPLERMPTVYEPFLVPQEVAKKLQEHPKRPQEEPKRAPKSSYTVAIRSWAPLWGLLAPLGSSWGILGGPQKHRRGSKSAPRATQDRPLGCHFRFFPRGLRRSWRS